MINFEDKNVVYVSAYAVTILMFAFVFGSLFMKWRGEKKRADLKDS